VLIFLIILFTTICDITTWNKVFYATVLSFKGLFFGIFGSALILYVSSIFQYKSKRDELLNNFESMCNKYWDMIYKLQPAIKYPRKNYEKLLLSYREFDPSSNVYNSLCRIYKQLDGIGEKEIKEQINEMYEYIQKNSNEILVNLIIIDTYRIQNPQKKISMTIDELEKRNSILFTIVHESNETYYYSKVIKEFYDLDFFKNLLFNREIPKVDSNILIISIKTNNN